MTDYIDARGRYRNARARTTATHKFAVGARVAFSVGPTSERQLFRVARHLPDGGQGLQYRISPDAGGQERVVVETALEAVQ